MISLRRYATYLGLAICIVLLFTLFREPILLTASNNLGPILEGPFQASYINATTGRLQWDLVPVRYPVKSLTPLPNAKPLKLPKVQFDFQPERSSHAAKRIERQHAVKDAFVRCWQAYREHAWMHDEVTPLSSNTHDGFGGWAASLVDSLDTLWIMGLKTEFEEAVTAAVEIDLTKSTVDQINVFETTIRHLGGFLSAYDLSGDERLLKKAKEFGDMLIVPFDTPNRMPITRWFPFNSLRGAQAADPNVLVAEIGSLSMEFTRLSMLTRDPKWYDAIVRIVRVFEKQQFESNLAGMWPVTINAKDMEFAEDSLFTLSAMSDSLYEYFPKMHALLGGVEPVYKKLYEGSMTTAVKYNLWRPMTPDNADILISGQIRKSSEDSKASLDTQGQHLVCFAGGMFALGGKLFNSPAHLDIAKKLTDGCIWTYKALPLGIMPEVFRMLPCDSKTECQWNQTRWEEGVLEENSSPTVEHAIQTKRLPKGFVQISDRRYMLRPEAIESVFLLYRMTGGEYLLDAAWEMFTAIQNVTETPLANAALRDITYAKDKLDFQEIQVDSMESFWMAETLKYFYLIFSEPDVISLDEWVFNTEAHPFKRRLPE